MVINIYIYYLYTCIHVYMYTITGVGPIHETMMIRSHSEYRFVSFFPIQCPLFRAQVQSGGLQKYEGLLWNWGALQLHHQVLVDLLGDGRSSWVTFGQCANKLWLESRHQRWQLCTGGTTKKKSPKWQSTKRIKKASSVFVLVDRQILAMTKSFSEDIPTWNHAVSRSQNHSDLPWTQLVPNWFVSSFQVGSLEDSWGSTLFFSFFLYSFNQHFISWSWRYKPHTIELDTVLKPFIPELIPSIGEAKHPKSDSMDWWKGTIYRKPVGMDQYLLVPFLGGWTSIYQLFWCSPGVQGFDTLPCDIFFPMNHGAFRFF